MIEIIAHEFLGVATLFFTLLILLIAVIGFFRQQKHLNETRLTLKNHVWKYDMLIESQRAADTYSKKGFIIDDDGYVVSVYEPGNGWVEVPYRNMTIPEWMVPEHFWFELGEKEHRRKRNEQRDSAIKEKEVTLAVTGGF